MNKIEFGDCRETMRRWVSDGVKVNTCVTSPPYYGLRDYGTAKWDGGDADCDHSISMPTKWNDPKRGTSVLRPETSHRGGSSANCHKCGATRIDSQIGLEETPEEYIKAMVEVFRCVWDVLAEDGTLWLNIGDSYSGNNSQASNNGRAGFGNPREKVVNRTGEGLKTKDLIGYRGCLPLRYAQMVGICVKTLSGTSPTQCLNLFKTDALKRMNIFFC